MQTTLWNFCFRLHPAGRSARCGWATWLSFVLPVLMVLAALGGSSMSATAQTLTQTFTLQPGWNAVWFEVKPANEAPGAVFNGLPVESVWTYNTPASSAQFIQDPVEAEWNRSSWRVFVPTNRIESINNNLFALQANRAYLVKLGGTAPALLTVTGRPSFHPPAWEPNAFNLRGLPVDPAHLPTFLDYFRPSAAHYDSAAGQLQQIFRLNAAGHWVTVAPTDLLRPGEALWIYSKGASDYFGPLGLDLDFGDGLAYDSAVDEVRLRVSNRSASPLVAALADVSGLANPALAYARQSATAGTEWITLPASLPVSLAAGESQTLRIAIRRTAFATPTYATVLDLVSGTGFRAHLPVTATKSVGGGALAGSSASRARPAGLPRPAGAQEDAIALAGLWTGKAQIDSVSEVNSLTDKTAPRPAKSPFTLHLLLHVDATGQTRLLREVIQLFAPGTNQADATGLVTNAIPPREVLLTDDTLLTSYQALLPRDGQAAGRRLSTSSYDFDTGAGNFLPLSGYFGGSQTVTGTLTLAPDLPTNPFYHRYHPDHDNLDASFQNYRAEAYEVTRQLSLAFSLTPPAGTAVADYGYQTIGGTYRETITGLHRENLVVQGSFLLQRVSTTAVLNQ